MLRSGLRCAHAARRDRPAPGPSSAAGSCSAAGLRAAAARRPAGARHTSSARWMRCASFGAIRAAASRVETGQLARAARPSLARARVHRSPPAAPASPAAAAQVHCRSARRYSIVPPTRSGTWRRRVDLADQRHGVLRELPGGVALAGIADVDQVMGNASRVPRAAGLAVPMSSPRYTCAESTHMISTGACAASRMAQSLLPLPVGPVRISTGSSWRPHRPRRTLAAPQEQLVELLQGEARPGGTAVIALVGALGDLHLPQQRIHLAAGSGGGWRGWRYGRRACRGSGPQRPRGDARRPRAASSSSSARDDAAESARVLSTPAPGAAPGACSDSASSSKPAASHAVRCSSIAASSCGFTAIERLSSCCAARHRRRART